MKKNYIITILIIAAIALIILGIFLFQNKNSQSRNNQQMFGNQNRTELSIDSLEIDDWVSVVAEKESDGSYTAEMISVCESKDNCFSGQQGGPSGEMTNSERQNPPSGSSGDVPSRNVQKSTASRSMLSGTIIEVGSGDMVLELDTGETTTIILSDSTKIFGE